MGNNLSAQELSMKWGDDGKQKLLNKLKNPAGEPGNHSQNSSVWTSRCWKSSFITSVDSALHGRVKSTALADSVSAKSFTEKTKEYQLKMQQTKLPFLLIDTKGLEDEHGSGMKIDDIIRILQGHINSKPGGPINEGRNKSLKDRIHCLVAVLPADKITLMEDDVMRQMRKIRLKARDLDIPQVIIMTKIDEASQNVTKDIKNIDTCKKIKQKVEECSSKLGVPGSYIYPVKNYHKEHNTNTEMDILILDALLNIVTFANDYVEEHEE